MDDQIDDRSIANIGRTARQAVGKVLIGCQVVTPRLAPKCFGDRSPLQLDGGGFALLLLRHLGGKFHGLAKLLRDRYIRRKVVTSPTHKESLRSEAASKHTLRNSEPYLPQRQL